MKQKDLPGRNDPCSCGSGRKYKHCCSGRGRKLSLISWVAIVALLAAASLLAFSVHRMTTDAPRGGDARETCPPGEVWSESHGHCH